MVLGKCQFLADAFIRPSVLGLWLVSFSFCLLGVRRLLSFVGNSEECLLINTAISCYPCDLILYSTIFGFGFWGFIILLFTLLFFSPLLTFANFSSLINSSFINFSFSNLNLFITSVSFVYKVWYLFVCLFVCLVGWLVGWLVFVCFFFCVSFFFFVFIQTFIYSFIYSFSLLIHFLHFF